MEDYKEKITHRKKELTESYVEYYHCLCRVSDFIAFWKILDFGLITIYWGMQRGWSDGATKRSVSCPVSWFQYPENLFKIQYSHLLAVCPGNS
jgi:hypothetical protein